MGTKRAKGGHLAPSAMPSHVWTCPVLCLSGETCLAHGGLWRHRRDVESACGCVCTALYILHREIFGLHSTLVCACVCVCVEYTLR